MKNNKFLIFIICIIAVVSYFAGGYSTYQVIAKAKATALYSAQNKIAELNERDGDSIELNHYFNELKDVPWKFSALYTGEIQTLQEQHGIAYAENYYRSERFHRSMDQLELDISTMSSNKIDSLKGLVLREKLKSMQESLSYLHKLNEEQYQILDLIKEKSDLQQRLSETANFQLGVMAMVNDTSCSKNPEFCEKIIALLQ